MEKANKTTTGPGIRELIEDIKGREGKTDKPVQIKFLGDTTSVNEFNGVLSKASHGESLTLLTGLLGLWNDAYKSPSLMPAVAAKIINFIGFYIRRQMTVYQTDETSLLCDLVPPKELGGKAMPFFNIRGEPEHIREYFNRLFPFSVKVPA